MRRRLYSEKSVDETEAIKNACPDLPLAGAQGARL
jgi:hypothetical protein